MVASVGSFCGTFMKKACLPTVSKSIELVVTTAGGLDDSVEEDKYSPLIRFADGTVFTGSSKDIISSPSSLSSIPDFTCKDLLLAFSERFTCVNCIDNGFWMDSALLGTVVNVLVLVRMLLTGTSPACN